MQTFTTIFHILITITLLNSVAYNQFCHPYDQLLYLMVFQNNPKWIYAYSKVRIRRSVENERAQF